MPTPVEQIAQIEHALCRRYFALVPKVERPNRSDWTEEKHDQNRLSRSLAAFAIGSVADVDDATAASALTDDEHDGGIDAVYYDRPGARLLLVQSKFKRSGAAPAQEEVLKTINGIRARRMFFRHGRYFTMAFVGHRSHDLLNKPELQVSNEDAIALSRRLNELYELIFAGSMPFQAFKGYLSIFRNLTDSQPLADRVLTRLAERDAADGQPQPVAVSNGSQPRDGGAT
jgi:hypothetical protein